MISWDQFVEMFCTHYIPRVERERLAQEFLDLKQGSDLVMEIMWIFIERVMFSPEFVLDHAQMNRYLSMLKTNIRQFAST